MKQLSVEAISTSVFKQGGDIVEFIIEHLKDRSLEGSVLAITSKIVSLAEDRVVSVRSTSKRDLVLREADQFLGVGGFNVELTIKSGILIASAGIDESNSENGDFILYPENPYGSAEYIWRSLCERLKLKKFGIIITDSHVMPLRKGVTGIGLSHYGFFATASRVNSLDIFGKPLKFTHINILDSLAAAAVLLMGEADEQCPLAILQSPLVEFSDSSSQEEVSIAPEDDIYFPLLSRV